MDLFDTVKDWHLYQCWRRVYDPPAYRRTLPIHVLAIIYLEIYCFFSWGPLYRTAWQALHIAIYFDRRVPFRSRRFRWLMKAELFLCWVARVAYEHRHRP